MARPQILGHRGASAAAPENTIDAFTLAIAQGADGVELDVRRSRDGALVLHHDAHLADGRLVAEVHRADLPAAVPDLAAALDALQGAVVNIEIKNIPTEADFDETCSLADAVVDLLDERARPVSDGDVVIVSSFHLATIDRVKALAPHLRTGWLTLLDPAGVATVGPASRRGHDAIHPYHLLVDDELVDAAHAAGLDVNVWTVDDPDAIRRLAVMGSDGQGVDGVVTNVPGVALAALTAQGGAA